MWEVGKLERFGDHLGEVLGLDACAVRDLLAAGDAVADHGGAVSGSHGGEERLLAYAHRDVVVLAPEAE